MQAKILKKILAAALVLTLVSGAVPIAPVADMFGGTVITANAEDISTVYSGFTATAGTTSGEVNGITIAVGSNEDYSKLVDGIKTTANNKWCVVEYGGNFTVPIYVEFNSGNRFVPTGYILTTGGDTQDNPGRNPKNWVIKAKNEGDADWTTLETVTNNSTLGAANNTSYEFAFANTNTTAYQYFRFEVSAIQSGGVFQLAEFEFVGHLADPTNLTYGSIDGLASKYYLGTSIDSLSYTVKDADGATVDPANYDIAFTKDGNVVNNLGAVGSYTVTVTGKGNYNGSCSSTFTVKKIDVTSIEGLNANYPIGTSINSLSYTVKDEDGATVDPQNFDVAFTKDGTAVNDLSVAGSYTMTVTGKGNYNGSCSSTFTVKKIDVTSIEGLNANYPIGTSINSLSYTVKDEDGATVDPQNFDVAFTKDGTTVNDLSVAGSYTMTVTSKNTYTGSCSATFNVKGVLLSGAGTEDTPYLIASSDDWVSFVDNVSQGITYQNQFIALTDDIRVTSTVGTESKPFKGTFDGEYNGQSHTMTVHISDTTTQGTAPFREISDGAVIKNLTVTGTVTGTTHAAGLVGFSRGGSSEKPNTIENCIVDVDVSVPATNGNRHMGGVVGHGLTSYLKITDTIFSGTMSNTNHYAGGLMGWCDSGCNLTIDNCLFNGSYTGTASNGFHPIAVCNNNATVTTNVQNCYYTAAPTLTSAGYIPVTTGEKVYSYVPFGYTTEQVSISGVSYNCYKVTAEPQSTLTINNASDWNSFAQNVSDGFTYEGIVIELDDDFGVTDMVNGTFKGTLNGKGHNITFNYTQDTENDAALFRKIDGATIEFLDVDGTINTSKKFAAAIAAHTYGTCHINSCISRININSSINGDGTHAGFVALSEGGCTLKISNSLFSGTITGSDTTRCGGFIGYSNSIPDISNSLMAGTLDINVTNDSATFSRNQYSGTDSYYRKSYGTVQGTAVGDKTNEQLAQALGRMWIISNDEVVPAFDVLDQLDYATVSGINALYAYTGNVIAVNPVVTAADGTVLTENVDYTAALTKDGAASDSVKDVGTYIYTFTPAANSSYTGTLSSAEFIVRLVDLSTATVTGINAEYVYSGSDIAVTPVITADNGKVLINGTEYITELKKNGTVVDSVNAVGTYTYTFTGVQAQGYIGTKTAEFIVKVNKPTGVQHTAFGTDEAVLSWNAQDNVTSYEVQYSKDKTFTEGSTTVTVTQNTADLTGLDTDSNYYVRVRAWNNTSSSEWSDTAVFETTSKRWIGFGAASIEYNVPLNNYYNYSITQQIYTAQEIGEAGLITSVDFMNTRDICCERNIDIYMVHTDKEFFNNFSDYVTITKADKVFSGTVDFATNKWTTIKFDTSFHYNGTQNVVLVVDDNTGENVGTAYFKSIDNTNHYYSLYAHDAYNNYDPFNMSNYYHSTQKNAVRFGIGTDAHTVSIDPTINASTISAPTEEMAGNKVTFSVNPVDGYYCTGVSVNSGNVEVTKNADRTYSFTMPDENAVISATFAQQYYVTVTWKNWDGTVLDTQQVGTEDVPAYSGETPTRPNDDYYSYPSFKGWDKEAEAITENKPVEFTAVYNKQPFYQFFVTVCDGTNNSRYAPYFCAYNYVSGNITQSVYPSSMLAGMSGKDIYSLTYYLLENGNRDIVVNGMKVYLLEVESDTLTGITDVADNANAVKVFEGNYTLAKSGTVRIDFTTPYHYNGGNLLISIQNSTAGRWDTRFFYGTDTDNVSSYNHYNSNNTSVKFLPKCLFSIVDESKYSVTLPEGMEFCEGSSSPAVAGSTVQFKVSEGYAASNVQANGTALTATDGIYTITVADGTEITADIVAYTPVVIHSVDINDICTPTTVYAEIYTSADYTVPANPYLDGYTFTGWKVNDGEPIATAEDVQSAVAALVAEKPEIPITVAVVYTKNNSVNTVIFSGDHAIGCTIKDADGNVITAGTSINVSEQLYAVANMGTEEQKFSHWLRIQGDKQTIVGYETTYAFRMPDENMILSAVYSDTEVEKIGTGYIESVKRTAENKLSFVSVLCVPDDCQMLKAGVVVQSTETLGGAELTKDNAKIIDYSDTSSSHYSSFKYTWTMSTTNHTKKWTVRPYLEYRDASGETQTIYGAAESKCVNDVNM